MPTKLKYELAVSLTPYCTTPCGYINDGTYIGSIGCEWCRYHVSINRNEKTVICKYKG